MAVALDAEVCVLPAFWTHILFSSVYASVSQPGFRVTLGFRTTLSRDPREIVEKIIKKLKCCKNSEHP
jgi:hypothetical protein